MMLWSQIPLACRMVSILRSRAEVKPRLPIEVCEYIIDAVFDDRYRLAPVSLDTLSSCALVCQAWRPRAQRVLFGYVILRDREGLYRFSELLDTSPELASYVQILALRGNIHLAYSTAMLFPAVLRGRLINLQSLYIDELDPEDRAVRRPQIDDKELSTLPIHPYFPYLLTSISRIRRLDLTLIRFPSFADFARVLNALSNLEELCCERVSWSVFGREPLCMRADLLHCSKNAFLPHINQLWVCMHDCILKRR